MNAEIFQLAQLTCAAQNKTPLPALDAAEWDSLKTLADGQRLSGFLFARLQKHPQRHRVPSPVLQHWHAYYMRQWAKNTRLLQEMERVQARWRGEILFFKGPLLAQRLYGAVDARAISDLDVLVSWRDDFADADAQLRALGYVRASRVLLTPRVSRWFTYHFEYHRDNLPLELHWHVQSHPSFKIDLRALWARRTSIALEDKNFVTLALQDELLTALLAVPIDIQLNKLTLRALYEMVLLARQLGETFAWDAWFAERARDRTLRVTRTALHAAAALFGREQLPRALHALLENAPTQNMLLATFADMSLWQRRRAAFSLYEYPQALSQMWWALSLGARLLAHPGETRKTWQRLKTI